MIDIDEKIQVTDEQLLREAEIEEVVELCANKKISENEAETRMDQLIRDGFKTGLFSKEDIRGYKQRKDRKSKYSEPRSHIQFALDLRKYHIEERKTFEYFVHYLTEIKKRNIRWELLGSDNKGYLMIANFSEREDSPMKPDYMVKWDDKEYNIEVKNFFKNYIWLKINNLKKYVEWNTYVVIKFKNLYYLFDKSSAAYLLNNKHSQPVLIKSKPSIIITPDGTGHNAHFSLKDLIKLNYVKLI